MINAHCYALMMKMLIEREVSRTEITEETGLHPVTVSRYVEQLRKVRVIHIVSWERDCRGKCWVPHYTLNTEKRGDAVKPKRISTAERSRRFREKQKQLKFINCLSIPTNPA